MSEIPQDSTGFPNTPVPPAAPHRTQWVAWGIIWLVVAYLLAASAIPSLRGRKQTGAPPQQIELSAKYAIGMKSLLPTSPAAVYFAEIEKLAETPEQKFRIALLAAELLSIDEATKRLDELTGSVPNDPLNADIELVRRFWSDDAGAAPADARNELISRYGFFAKIALGAGPNADAALHAEVVAAGRRTAIILIVAIVLAAIGGLVGLILLVIGIVLACMGTLRAAYEPAPLAPGVYLEMFAVYLLGFVVLSLLLALAFSGSPSLGASWLLSIIVPIAIAWGLFRGESWAQIRTALGWHCGRGVHVEIPLGVAGYLAGLPIVAVGFGITYFLLRMTGTTPSHPIQGVETDSFLSALQLYGIACVWAPVIEETMFRGALLHHLRRRWSWIISAALVAFIFAAIHPQGWTFIPVLGSIAIVLAGLREWRGSIIAPMVAHACNNFVMISLFLLVK